MNEVKQVILIRKDLKMGKGKIASQASHACMSVFFRCIRKTETQPEEEAVDVSLMKYASYWSMPNLPYFEEYITGSFTKVVVGVDSEEELLKYYNIALDEQNFTAFQLTLLLLLVLGKQQRLTKLQDI